MRDAAPTLSALRGAIARLETQPLVRSDAAVPLGHAPADAALQGGIKGGALHEVFAPRERDSSAALGFAAGLTLRVAGSRPVFWIRQDFAALAGGEVFVPGLADLGLDPDRVLLMRTPDATGALRAALEALSCAALGAVVIELRGEAKSIDLVASRRLTLTAAQSGVTALLLRAAAEIRPSTAETRWAVSPASSSPSDDWGMPVFNSHLVRNRRGPTGRWLMEWNADDRVFREPPHSRAVSAKPLRRPHLQLRLASADNGAPPADNPLVVVVQDRQCAAADRGRCARRRRSACAGHAARRCARACIRP